MALHPTKTRLQLLADIDAGNVVDGITETGAFLLVPGHRALKVTDRVEELEREGWAGSKAAYPRWSLTDAGRTVLEGATTDA